MSHIESFTGLIVWQRAHELIVGVYKLTRLFPSDEKFGLTSQLRRAAVSVAANIAEGYKRSSKREKRQFFLVSSASLEETRAELIIAKSLGFGQENEYPTLFQSAEETSRLLQSWISRFSEPS
jgi:four helix bundle protein